MPPTIWPRFSKRSLSQRIDLYGDSYGTYFEQVFAIRHPNLLRSIVLDGAYPLNGAGLPVVSELCAGDAR